MFTHAGAAGRHAGERIRSLANGVAHELDPVDVVELLVLPLVLYLAHVVDDVAKNHVEPNRTLLRPRPGGHPVRA